MKKRILLIDDEVNIVESLADLLELEGYETCTASDGAKGYKMALEAKPDLILCDVMMPGMDGFAVLDAVRKNEKTVQTPFVFLTAKGHANDFRQGMDLGADDYLLKPIEAETLFEVVKKRLAKHHQLRETGQLEENHRINQELHDTLQQTLLGLKMRLTRFREKLVKPENQRDVEESLEFVNLAFTQLRMILEYGNTHIQPDAGFVASLEKMIERVSRYVDFEISLHNDLEVEIPRKKATVLFKVLLEVLNNAIKHSRANKLFIHLTGEGSLVSLVILDDGCGFDPDSLDSGNGLKNICERIKEIGGQVHISSEVGDGTSIEITFDREQE